jgi:hypothetical protein
LPADRSSSLFTTRPYACARSPVTQPRLTGPSGRRPWSRARRGFAIPAPRAARRGPSEPSPSSRPPWTSGGPAHGRKVSDCGHRSSPSWLEIRA